MEFSVRSLNFKINEQYYRYVFRVLSQPSVQFLHLMFDIDTAQTEWPIISQEKYRSLQLYVFSLNRDTDPEPFHSHL